MTIASDEIIRLALLQAAKAAGVASTTAALDAAAADLIAHYDEPIRAYHNSAHIVAMLHGLAETSRPHGTSPALLLAILYHDVIYDPRRSDNETASAAFAISALTALSFRPEVIARVTNLIRMTQHGAHAPDRSDVECALLLDLDLAILGADNTAYQAYAAAIRREYAHVPDALYRPGRARVLQSFVDLPAIYRTLQFKARLETPARANLIAEREALVGV